MFESTSILKLIYVLHVHDSLNLTRFSAMCFSSVVFSCLCFPTVVVAVAEYQAVVVIRVVLFSLALPINHPLPTTRPRGGGMKSARQICSNCDAGSEVSVCFCLLIHCKVV